MPIDVALAEGERMACRLAVTGESGRLVEARVINPPHHTTIDDLAPGAYTVNVTGLDAASPITAISATTVVWDPDRGGADS